MPSGRPPGSERISGSVLLHQHPAVPRPQYRRPGVPSAWRWLEPDPQEQEQSSRGKIHGNVLRGGNACVAAGGAGIPGDVLRCTRTYPCVRSHVLVVQVQASLFSSYAA